MAYAFAFGGRIIASAKGLKTFRNWAGRQGTIVNASPDENVWQVKWDGRVAIEAIHADFLAPLSLGQMDPDFPDTTIDAKRRHQA
jgi:hypothetical protein